LARAGAAATPEVVAQGANGFVVDGGGVGAGGRRGRRSRRWRRRQSVGAEGPATVRAADGGEGGAGGQRVRGAATAVDGLAGGGG